MWPFWLMFFVPLFAVISPRPLRAQQATVVWVMVGLLFFLLVGLRHEVGGDWYNYLRGFQHVVRQDFWDTLTHGDPGYHGLSWVVAQLGGDIYAVNLVCAAISVGGLMVFCRAQPNPWLALLVAVPYIIVVVAMGYTRQSVALGFVCLGLVALAKAQVRRFVILVILGALFHKSAVLLLPIAALAASRRRVQTAALVLATAVLMYWALLSSESMELWETYVDSGMVSFGGPIRIALVAIPGAIFLSIRHRLSASEAELRLWTCMSLFALVCIPLVAVASTAVDRMAIYLMPIQLYVFSRIPRLFAESNKRSIIILGICLAYAAVLYVWLNYAIHAKYWLPYDFMPLWA